MKKCKLPKNWITVSSKSHPDRVYYFNVKTNQSSWKEPTLEQDTDKSSEPIRKRYKHCHEEEECSKARTSEHDIIENKKSDRQQSLNNKKSSQVMKKTIEMKRSNKTNKNFAQDRMQILRKNLNHEIQKQKEDNCSIIVKKYSEKVHKSLPISRSEKNETPDMKALREKILQRKLQKPAIRNRSSSKNQEHSLVSPFLKKSSEHHKTVTSLDKNETTLNKNETTFTPQMHALYEKIQKRSNAFVVNKKPKEDSKNKQELKITKQTLMKTPEKKGENIPNRRDVDKHDIKQEQRNKTNKNLAQKRMQTLRNSLNREMQKCEENDCSIITEIPLERLNQTLPVSSCNNNIESISIRKNADIRLKRLHNRLLKETVYGKNAMLNNNKLQIQQNNKPGVIASNTTKDQIVQEINEVLYEEMDWEPLKDDEITLEVEVVRAQLNNENCANVSNCPLGNTTALTQPSESQEKGPLYIVIDTNVFLTNIEIIEQARDSTLKNYSRPFIVIPWTVICELDYLKNDKSRSETLSTKARKAISFINEHFASKHPRIVGQTREQAAMNKENFSLDCPDDEILQCCLQIKNLNKDVVLLSYDKNLCTKAMIHCIMTIGRDDFLENLDNLNTSDKTINHLSNNVESSILSEELRFSDEFFEDAKLIMKILFSTIIVKQMTEIFGPDWEMYVIIKPPWTVVTALKCIMKHWIAAINESFRQYRESIRNTVRELLEIFERLPVGGRKLQDVEYTLEKCSDIIQAINGDKHCDLMTQSLNAIMWLAASIAGKAFPLNHNSMDPPLSHTTVKRLQPDITKKVTDLSQNLNILLVQAENNSIKHQALRILQQNLNAFLTYIEITTMNVELLDIFYCVILKEEMLKIGLRQLQELGTHYRALELNTCI